MSLFNENSGHNYRKDDGALQPEHDTDFLALISSISTEDEHRPIQVNNAVPQSSDTDRPRSIFYAQREASDTRREDELERRESEILRMRKEYEEKCALLLEKARQDCDEMKKACAEECEQMRRQTAEELKLEKQEKRELADLLAAAAEKTVQKRTRTLNSVKLLHNELVGIREIFARVAEDAAKVSMNVDSSYHMAQIANLCKFYRSLAGSDLEVHAQTLEHILHIDYGAERFAPSVGDEFDSMCHEKTDSRQPGGVISSVIYDGWRLSEGGTVILRAVVEVTGNSNNKK